MTIKTLPFDTSTEATMELIVAKACRNVGPRTSIWNPYLKSPYCKKIKILTVQQKFISPRHVHGLQGDCHFAYHTFVASQVVRRLHGYWQGFGQQPHTLWGCITMSSSTFFKEAHGQHYVFNYTLTWRQTMPMSMILSPQCVKRTLQKFWPHQLLGRVM